MSRTLARRDLFRLLAGRTAPLRPPFAVSEADFAAACDGCGACIPACPRQLLRPGSDKRPVIDFAHAGCDFCGKCWTACPSGALHAGLDSSPWRQHAVAGDACLEVRGVACRACQSTCEVDAIRFRPRVGGRNQITIDAISCTGCGACISSCPVAALKIKPGRSEIPLEESAS